MRQTYHLVPADVWAAGDPAVAYAAPSLALEGFIHCTDGRDALIATANRHYRDDPRAFLAVTLDLDQVAAPWSVEDEARIYPHIFGVIDRTAVLGVTAIRRDEDGAFVDLED